MDIKNRDRKSGDIYNMEKGFVDQGNMDERVVYMLMVYKFKFEYG